MTPTSISSFGRVVVVLRVVIVTLAEARAKGPPQRPDLFGLRLIVSAGEPAQVPVAQLRPFLKVRRDGFLGDLLPRDIDEKFLKRDGVRVPLAELQECEIPRCGFAAGAVREDRFRLSGPVQIRSQFPRVLGAREGDLSRDGWVKLHLQSLKFDSMSNITVGQVPATGLLPQAGRPRDN